MQMNTGFCVSCCFVYGIRENQPPEFFGNLLNWARFIFSVFSGSQLIEIENTE